MHAFVRARNLPVDEYIIPIHKRSGLPSVFSFLAICRLFFLLAMFFGPFISMAAEKPTICAILPMPGVESTQQAADLLEAKLAGQEGITLVNRTDFEKVVTEQVLSTAFAADGVKSRIELGKMLKADLLVFLRERKSKVDSISPTTASKPSDNPSTSNEKPKQVIELAVADTHRGLRLVMDIQFWEPDKTDATLKAFAEAIGRARDLAGRDDLKVFAVPPFESKNISFKYQQMKWGYARLIEERLMLFPGVVVVELSEAKAMTSEVSLSAITLQRSLPYYLLGSFKISDSSEQSGVDFIIDFKRGSDVLKTYTRENVALSKVADTLLLLVPNILGDINNAPPSHAESVLELDILKDRGEMFRIIGDYDEALALLQSAYLLDPTNNKIHLSMYLTLIKMSDSPGILMDMYDTYDYLTIQYADMALDHLHILLANKYLINELCDYMRTRVFQVRSDSLLNDPYNILADFVRVSQRHASIICEFFQDTQYVSTLNNNQIYILSNYALLCLKQSFQYAQDDALNIMCYMLNLLNNANVDILTMCHAIASFTIYDDTNLLYKPSIERLRQYESGQLHTIGILMQFLYDITDINTYNMAVSKLSELSIKYNYNEDMKTHLKYWAQVRLNLAERNKGLYDAKPSVMVPLLTRVVDKMTFIDNQGNAVARPTIFYDWLNCGSETEIVATDAGLFLVDDNDIIKLIDRWAPYRMYWDGEYVWTINEKSIIYVIKPRPLRVIACFDDNDMIEDNHTNHGLLTVISPGRACCVRSIWQNSKDKGSVLRSWITMLEIQDEPNTDVVKNSNVIFQTMRQGKDEGDIIASFIPVWLTTISDTDLENHSMVIVGRMNENKPLIVDNRNNVRFGISQWKYGSNIIEVNKCVYITTGCINNYKEYFEVSKLNSIDDIPENILCYERKAKDNVFCGVYHRSLLVHDNKLHMLANWSCCGIDCQVRCVPAWSTIDLITGEAKLLVDVFPYKIRYLPSVKLCKSNHYGLILLYDNEAYRVELPPDNTWPNLDAKVNKEIFKCKQEVGCYDRNNNYSQAYITKRPS